MSARRLAQTLLPQLTRGFRSSARTQAGGGKDLTHHEICYGDGHKGLRPGYNYDWEHGPHYLAPWTIPNFNTKFRIGMITTYIVAFSIPVVAVTWQQYKRGG